jgi:putative NIF3 family GTP cyclohydrolase 1 type 2
LQDCLQRYRTALQQALFEDWSNVGTTVQDAARRCISHISS